jgi:sRNA-binding regulator protein Hfq
VPREVFAEEIETFLERLDAVTAVGVVANEAGEIERIYATTESSRDDGAIRRAITSALMSQFSLPVDGWRVQIAHLQPSPGDEGFPTCQLVRLEETMTQTLTRVVVDLRYEREGVQKTVSGTAQAPPGQAHRLRTVALATVEALRPLIERAGNRPSLEGLTLMPFAGATVALAAVALASDRASLLQVGAEAVVASEAEAVVGAVIDAVQKPPRLIATPGRVRSDRLRQFDGLRAHYERLIRAEVGARQPAAALEATALPGEAGEGEPEQGQSGGGESRQGEFRQGESWQGEFRQGESWQSGAAGPAASGGAAAGDVIRTMNDIRPERQGGAATVMREDIRAEGATGTKAPPRLSVEDAFYRRLVATGAPVYIRCRDGYEIPTAIVRDFGTYSLLIEVNGMQELVFKHGIIAIRLHGPLPPESGPPS